MSRQYSPVSRRWRVGASRSSTSSRWPGTESLEQNLVASGVEGVLDAEYQLGPQLSRHEAVIDVRPYLVLDCALLDPDGDDLGDLVLHYPLDLANGVPDQFLHLTVGDGEVHLDAHRDGVRNRPGVVVYLPLDDP